jgi:CBS domain-containing protein
MLVFVAMFVFLAGRAEAQLASAKTNREQWLVGDAMRRQFQMLPADITLQEVGQALAGSDQTDFPVIDQGQLVGMLAKLTALRLLDEGYGYLRVENVMRRDLPTLDPNAPLMESLDQMHAANYSSLPVAHAGQLVGVLPTLSARIGP